MKEVQVPGVLNRNSKTRDEHLNRNYGKYFQYNENLTPAIGEVYNIDYNRPLYSITDNQSLLEYTHNGSQKYGDSINRKYFNKNREKDIYSINELNFDQIQAWGGDYTDYISYLDEVLGEDIYSRHVRYINDFLSGQYMENALRQTEVGVVRDINVPVAKQGIITTNPNNLKGLDTPLGTITNFMYSTLLYNGAIFNSDRKSEDKYITRSLINQYGNNLSNITKLGDMLRVGVGDYELRDDLGADAHIIHSLKDAVGDLNIHWKTKNVENAKKYLAEFNEGFNGYELGKDGYVNYIEGKESVLDLTDFSKEVHFKSEYNQGYDKSYDIYNENDNVDNGYTDAPTDEDDAAWENYKKIDGSDETSKSILSKTSRLFNQHKINTLVGRFHTSVDGGIPTEQEFIDTAKSKYGNSHGRNLLTRKAQDSEVTDADDTNGYDNPYCRTWTYHHQYNQVKKLIRPFITVDDNGEAKAMSIEAVQLANGKYRSRDKDGKLVGPKYLGDNTVLNKNGFVNICPSGDQSVIDTTDATSINANAGTRIEKCMFSIENLAWKDVPKFTKENYISKEQTGPNGGRIMWFPPYDLSFSENVNVGWNESTFIGRGEKVYTYTNTDRTGTLSFTLLIDHPSIVNSFARLDDGDISSDIDSDILRYFAGCDMPEIKDSDDDNNKNEKDIDKGEEEIKRHEKFSFYVYFPNNFSGIVSDKSGNKIRKYDSDWWKYILVGNNCEFFRSNDALGSDKNAWVGYEMTKGEGISKHYNIENIDKELEKDWIGVSQCHWDRRNDCIGDISSLYSNDAVDKNGDEVVNRTNGNWCFKYKVDNDLRQKLGAYLTEPNPTNVSFIDKESNQLNSKLNNKEFQKGADYTFGEVIAALLTAKKLNTKNSNNSMGNLSNIEADALLEFLLKNGCSKNSIKKLSEYFKADGFKIDSIKIFGSADSNDKKNSSMLAMRRAESIKRLFTEDVYEIKIDNEKIKSSSQSSQSDPSKSANDKENKLQRYAFVTVEYSLPGTKQALSSMSESTTNKKENTYEEEQEDENNFNTWFGFLLSNSEIISEYRKIFDNEDYEYQYDLFKEDIKNWCIDNGISYDDAESVTKEEWINIINKLTKEYGYDYFIPAYKIDSYGNDFTTQLKKHEPINSDANIDKEISQVSAEMVKLIEESEDYNKEASGLTKELNELNKKKQEKNLDGKIGECEEKISCYTYGMCKTSEGAIVDCESGTTHYQSEINRINYELSHWTTDKGDKKELLNELKRCEREKSKLEEKIGKEQVKEDKYKQELEEINEEISGLTEQIEKYEEKATEDWNKANDESDPNSLAFKLNQLRDKKRDGYGLIVNKIKSEIYFERFAQNITKVLDKLNGCGTSGMSCDFNYHEFDGGREGGGQQGPLTNLFETGIILQIPDMFPYIGYEDPDAGIEPDKSFIDTAITEYKACKNSQCTGYTPTSDGYAKMSYNLLLKEYLLAKLLEEKVETGFEFACDYLMATQESETKEDATNDDKSDYEQIKDLLLIQYLLSGEKNKEQNNWNISTEGTNANISYYDAWEYMIENESKLSIVYEPFIDALHEVNSAITAYRNSYNDVHGYSADEFKNMIKVLTGNTESVLKYCETVIEDIMSYVVAYAETTAYEAAEAAEKAAKEKETQKLKKKYRSECDTLANIKDSVNKKKDQYLYSVFAGSGYTRYETESEYFEKLDIEHPLIFKSIKEKFKYFNPAFHSMSPEGFNARLNFLHQCTRQGHTYEAKSGNGIKTAHNLAFGRMPVCVLRIGDFINTRIIINNININYDNGGMQWDLNPEGVGVQPMYAKVNLGITIIGGQTLTGPISRLQNAVSFDYYANTGVYDDRADRMHKGIDGNDVYDYVFNIKPKKEDNGKYTLYRSAKSVVEQANEDTITTAQNNKKAYDEAKKELNDYKLIEGNSQCKK